MSIDLQPNFQRGDVLSADALNQIVDQLLRPLTDVRAGDGLALRKGPRGQVQITATPDRSFLIRLTGNGSGGAHEWKDVVWTTATSAYIDGSQTDQSDTDSAYELQGLDCPLGDEVFQAWRDDAGRLLFEAKPIEGTVTTGTISAGSLTDPTTGGVTAWSYQSGTLTSAGLGITAVNRWATEFSGGVKLIPNAGSWMIATGDC